MSFNHTLLTHSYWFNLSPGTMYPPAALAWFILSLLLLAVGIVFHVFSRSRKDRLKKKLFRRGASCGITMGMIVLLLVFFSYEEISLLGARFWYLFWFIGMIVWLVFILRYAFVTIPGERVKQNTKDARSIYLPKSKKK